MNWSVVRRVSEPGYGYPAGATSYTQFVFYNREHDGVRSCQHFGVPWLQATLSS